MTVTQKQPQGQHQVGRAPAPPPVDPTAGFVTTDYDAELDREHAEAQHLPGGAELEAEFRTAQPAQPSAQPPAQPPQQAAQPPAQQPPQAQPAQPTAQQPPAQQPQQAAQPPAQQPPQAEQPPAQQQQPAPQTLDTNERFRLADNLEMSRGDVVKYLQAYNGAINEVQAFRQTFGMTGDKAIESWAPVLSALRDNAQRGGKIADIVGDVIQNSGYGPEFEEYMRRCLDTYAQHAQQNGTATPQQRQAAQGDPETRQRVTQLEQEVRREQFARAQEYVHRERDEAFARYPVLQSRTQLWEALVQRAFLAAQSDPSYTISRAIQDNKAWIEEWQQFDAWQRNAATAQPQPKPQQQHVPALVSGGGAAPSGTREDANLNEELQFNDGSDAVQDWIKNRSRFGFTD